MWKVYVDGSSNAKGIGTWMIVESPEGLAMEHSLQLKFPTSNYYYSTCRTRWFSLWDAYLWRYHTSWHVYVLPSYGSVKGICEICPFLLLLLSRKEEIYFTLCCDILPVSLMIQLERRYCRRVSPRVYWEHNLLLSICSLSLPVTVMCNKRYSHKTTYEYRPTTASNSENVRY